MLGQYIDFIELTRIFAYHSDMKKIIISILLVTVLCTASVFAQNWTVSLTAGYDHQSCNDNSCDAFGITFGARSKFNEKLDMYADFSTHFAGTYKFVIDKDTKLSLPEKKMGFKSHLGFIYNVSTNSENFNLGLGLGASLARSTAAKELGTDQEKYGFTNLGIALIGIGQYKINDKFALQGEIIPDMYFMNWNTKKEDHRTTIDQSNKLGFGLSAKLGVAYSF